MQIKLGDVTFPIGFKETKNLATCQFEQECVKTGLTIAPWAGGSTHQQRTNYIGTPEYSVPSFQNWDRYLCTDRGISLRYRLNFESKVYKPIYAISYILKTELLEKLDILESIFLLLGRQLFMVVTLKGGEKILHFVPSCSVCTL